MLNSVLLNPFIWIKYPNNSEETLHAAENGLIQCVQNKKS